MDENVKKKARPAEVPDQDLAYYVYCIFESSMNRELASGPTSEPIEDGAGFDFVTVNNLTAVASRVPLDSYAEENLERHLEDPSWMAVRAMRHEHLVEHFAKRTSVVPLRFGTIYLQRAGIERMLTEQNRKLLEIIERLRGNEEWGVNVYSDRATLLEKITSLSPKLREMNERANEASPGQAYLLKKKIEALRVDEVRSEIARVVDHINIKLGTESSDARTLRVLKVEATEYGELKAKFAYLVARARFETFREVAESLALELQPGGFRLELTGPWPAYNFASETTNAD